jgi:hypothetical protein
VSGQAPHRSDAEILGRAGPDEIEAIIGVAPTDPDEILHAVEDHCEALFTWDYEKASRPRLDKLYEKAKTAQWNAQVDLDWSIEVDPLTALSLDLEGQGSGYWGSNSSSPTRNWGSREWDEFTLHSLSWRLSQFAHGEQGALLCTAKIVETVPWIDAKYYAATQVVDEARHLEAFNRYLDEKVGVRYPINPHLRVLLDEVIADNRWDMTYLGMQIMVEGLALAAFGFMRQFSGDPLLSEMLRYVMADEARHVAFGVLSLQEVYSEMTTAEIRERQEFAFEAAVRMRDRFIQQEVWEHMGVDARVAAEHVLNMPPEEQIFQQMLFTKIVPNCKKLGLLDAADGWLRDRFTEIGVIHFEDLEDTSEELGFA